MEDLGELARKSQDGDKVAYKQLLTTITPMLSRFVSKSFRQVETREDVLQDILLSIHKALHTYIPDRDFKSWMYAIAKFRTVDQLRKIYRKKDREVLSDSLETAPNKVTESAPESNHVVEALELLPEKYREAIRLTKLQEFSVREAAAKLQISENALKARCSRGYKMLRKKLEKAVYERT